MGKTFKTIDDAVIRFAGDSGDGMQLTGGRFTETTAVVGNDLIRTVSRADGTCIKALKFFVQLICNVGRPNFGEFKDNN